MSASLHAAWRRRRRGLAANSETGRQARQAPRHAIAAAAAREAAPSEPATLGQLHRRVTPPRHISRATPCRFLLSRRFHAAGAQGTYIPSKNKILCRATLLAPPIHVMQRAAPIRLLPLLPPLFSRMRGCQQAISCFYIPWTFHISAMARHADTSQFLRREMRDTMPLHLLYFEMMTFTMLSPAFTFARPSKMRAARRRHADAFQRDSSKRTMLASASAFCRRRYSASIMPALMPATLRGHYAARAGALSASLNITRRAPADRHLLRSCFL